MKLYSIELKGEHWYWSITTELTEETAIDLRADGFSVSELLNTIPTWVPAKYIYHYCWLQDVFNFKFLTYNKRL